MATPPPIRKNQTNIDYFLVINEEQKGPFDIDKIKVLLQQKEVDENTLIWKDGMDDWELISKLPEFGMQGPNENSNLNDFESEKNRVNEVKSEQSSDITGKKNAFKWIKLIGLTALMISVFSVGGAIQQYFQFESTKEVDNSYIGPFSAWGSIIGFVLGLSSFVLIIRKKESLYPSVISLVLAITAFILVMVTESKYRSFWQPLWDSDYQLWDMSEVQRESVRDGWKDGTIDSDSLKRLKEVHSYPVNTD
jgi:hypothetical protein